MLELAERLLPLLEARVGCAVATSIDVIGSAPQLVGTSMVTTEAGDVLGSVSGGCVEGAVLRECSALLADDVARIRRLGFGDAAAARAGLACGGELDVLVHRLDPVVLPELRAAALGAPAVVGFVVSGPPALLGRAVVPTTVDAFAVQLPGSPVARLHAALEGRRDAGTGGLVDLACGDATVRLYVDVAAPRRRMIVGGATESAVALADLATAVGYRVTVCDPQAALLQPGRFREGVEVVVARPHDVVRAAALTARDAVCLLGHDEDLDALALLTALESGAGFVGALGSRATAARRRAQLAALGADAAALERIRMPIGLDIGARTPPELGIAILAEVLAERAGRDAAPLRSGSGPIHRAAPTR